MSTTFLSCNGHGTSPLHLLVANLVPYFRPLHWGESCDREVIYTFQARNAIALLCKALQIGPKDEVLVPAYNCGAEIDPYFKAGANAILYGIDEKLRVDIDDIIRKIRPATRIIHVTHFFGWPQDITSLAKLCKEKKIFLIEDCAQALFSNGPDNSIGKTGDAAVYSFVKSLPSPDGGALVVNSGILREPSVLREPPLKYTLRSCMPLLKKWFMNSNSVWQKYELTRNFFIKSWKKNPEKKGTEPRPTMLKSNYLLPKNIDLSISRISRGVVASTDVAATIEKRRRNFSYLQKELFKISGIFPVFDSLPDGVCPMSFPFMVKNRKQWTDSLDNKGILVQGWPGYYPGFNWDEFPVACSLKDNLLTLPVHQYLDSRHNEYIVACVKEISLKVIN